MTMIRALGFAMAVGIVLVTPVARRAGAQSLEEQTRRPPGTSSLHDDSEQLKQNDNENAPTDSLDDDSMELRGRTPDQDGTNSLDDGAMQGGNGPDAD